MFLYMPRTVRIRPENGCISPGRTGSRAVGLRQPLGRARPAGAGRQAERRGEAAQIVRGGRSNRAWECRSELNIQ